MKKALIFSLLISLVSCSSLSKNTTKTGGFSIKNGYHNDISWDDDLKFDRYSWYHEWTLLLDVMMGKIDKKSPFYNWFSRSEKGLLNKCIDSYVTMSYHLDSSRLSKNMFLAEMEKLGYEKILVPRFKRTIELHPDHEKQSLQLYDTFVLCRKKMPTMNKKRVLRMPNYPQIDLR